MGHIRLFFPVAILVACSIGVTGIAEISCSSSKALRIALEAKQSIDSHDESSIRKASERLEELLHEPSFRRLEPKAQVQILLWLSKGYERLGKYQEQEKLLTSYAKKLELYQFHTVLKAAVARSFVQQNRLLEADDLLQKCIGSSCAHLPLEEKAEIALVLSYKDEHINSLFRQADKLSETGNFSEALKVYETLLPSVEQQAYLYQASPVEKQRLLHVVRLRIAELSFCLGDFSRIISLLIPWNAHLFPARSDRLLLDRRLFLLASAYERLGNEDQAKALWQEYQAPADNRGGSEALLLWKVKKALQAGSYDEIASIAEDFQRRSKTDHPLPLALHSLSAALCFDFPLAVHEAQRALQGSDGSLHKGLEGVAVHVLGECGFARMMLLVCSGQSDKAEALGRSLLPLLTLTAPSTALRASAIHLFLYQQERGQIDLDAAKALLQNLKEPLPDELLPLFEFLFYTVNAPQGEPSQEMVVAPLHSTADRFFAAWMGDQGSTPVTFLSEPAAAVENTPDPFTKYLRALSSCQRALSGEGSAEQASQDIRECLESAGLRDVRPHLYHCLIDLAARSARPEEAYDLVWELIREDREYPGLPQAILTTIFALESQQALANQRASLCQYIFDRTPPDVYTIALSFHLYDTPSVPRVDHASNQFEHALIARNEGRLLVIEASKTKEPRLIKERLEGAIKAFETARTQALESMKAFHDAKSLSVLWGFVLTIGSEQVELLERYLPSDDAFNELPALLEAAASHVEEDLRAFEGSFTAHYLQKSFLSSCQSLVQTAPIFERTFHRELDAAAALANALSNRSSRPAVRSLLYLSRTLREAKRPSDALQILSPLKEKRMTDEYELALEIAMEKSLCFREMQKPDKSMALLAWIINGPYASSLRIKAMIVRADLYLHLHRKDLAIRQLDSVVAKGGEWGAVAERKLKELYGTN